MTSKYEALKAVLGWCKSHPNRDTFYYYEVGCHQRSVASLCDSPYRNKIWLVRKGVSEKRDATHGLMRYALSPSVLPVLKIDQ